MNPSQALSIVLVDELVRGGVREAVLAPGSRSAPLAFALLAAERAGALRLHVRVDERSAAYLALGLAKASARPVPVVCTSGTAAANFHPAVLEAHHAGVPLLLLTADRPVELHGTGANQTTHQVGLYGAAVRAGYLIGPPEDRPEAVAGWRSLVCRALGAALGTLGGPPGPVHLDIALREPLVPGEPGGWGQPLDGRPGGAPWTELPARADAAPWTELPAPGPDPLVEATRTLMLVGDGPRWLAEAAGHAGRAHGWPVLAEPTGYAAGALGHMPLLLADPGFLAAAQPERVVAVGRLTLSRPVQRLLSDPRVRVEVVSPGPGWADPGRQAAAVHPPAWLAGRHGPGDPGFLALWQAAARAVRAVLDGPLGGAPGGPALARALLAALPSGALLVLGSSSPVRDVDAAATPRSDLTVLANRGLAGIDGTVSTAIGAALAHGAGGDSRAARPDPEGARPDPEGAPLDPEGARAVPAPAFALLGDLTFLHDSNGLLIGPDEPRPDLTIVVANDDGGAIFTTLEQGAPAHRLDFERLFGTPTGVDLAALCAATGTPHRLVADLAALPAELVARPGLRVLEVRLDRARRRAQAQQLREAVGVALAEVVSGH